MKIVGRIIKENNAWVGYSPDGSFVSLSSWLSDSDLKFAVSQGMSVNNLFKVKVKNRYYALGHPLGEWSGYEGTTVVG